jgi:hypothetical protein
MNESFALSNLPGMGNILCMWEQIWFKIDSGSQSLKKRVLACVPWIGQPYTGPWVLTKEVFIVI